MAKKLNEPQKFEAEGVVVWEKLDDKKIVWDEQPLKKELELRGGKLKGQKVNKLHKRSLLIALPAPAGLGTKYDKDYQASIKARFEPDKKGTGKVAFMSVTKEFCDGADVSLTGKDVLITYRIVPSTYKDKKDVFLNVMDIEVLPEEAADEQ